MICEVNIYVDENSICKVDTKSGFLELIYNLLKVSSVFKIDIEGILIQFILWRRRDLEGCQLCVDEKTITFLAAVNELLETDTKKLFKTVFYDKFSRIWNDEQVHSDDIFYEMFNGECVTGGTFAECAELTLVSKKFPIAFVNNRVVSGKSTTVIKGWEGEDRVTITIELADTNVDLKTWLNSKFSVADFCYDMTTHIPPTDEQSYLKDRSKYTKTSYRNQGRIVYFCNLDRTYHVIDNLHYGESSHIEIWDRFGNHLGENSLIGVRVSGSDKEKNNPAWLD